MLLVGAVGILGCGEESPDKARSKLAEQGVPVDNQTLIAKTKEGKAGEDAARLLVVAGTDPNARQENGMTVLMSAVFNGQFDAAKALIARGADVNASAKGFTALRLAVERGNADMVKLLLDHGANPDLRPDGAPSARHKAEDSAHADIQKLLKAK